jgi:protein-disulfide isomerase
MSKSISPRSGAGTRHFYLLLAGLALVGLAILAAQVTRRGVSFAGFGAQLDADAITRLGNRTLGREDAPLTIVEFADFQCGGCATYAQRDVPKIKGELVEEGLVRYVFADFPLPRHPHALLAARAGRCANEQGAFWAFHDRLFAEHEHWAFDKPAPTEKLTGYAGEVGMDRKKFESCLESHRYESEIAQSQEIGRSVGVRATPSLVVNGRLLDDVPSADALRKLALAEQARQSPASASVATGRE